MVITNKDGKPQYVPNPFEDLYETVPKLSKVPDSIRNQLDYDDYRDEEGDSGQRDTDDKDARPTAPDDTGARFGNNLGGGPDDFAGGHHFFDDFSPFGVNGNSQRGGRPISPGAGRRPRSPGPQFPPSRRQRARQRRPPPPQYEQVIK